MTPIVRYRCHGWLVSGASSRPPPISATPSSIAARGPERSIRRTISGLSGGDQKAERERARGDATLPSELVEDRRKEQRKRSAGVGPDRHGDEGHDGDDPAVKERKPHLIMHR